MLAKQDNLAGRRSAFAAGNGGSQIIKNLTRLPLLDFATIDKSVDKRLEQLVRRTRRRGNTARVEFHVAGLNPARYQSAQSGKVLCKPDCDHELGQFMRALRANQCQTEFGRRVVTERAADRANLERQREFADERTVAADVPSRQRSVATVRGCECMCARLKRTPIVTGRNGKRINAIHDALVVCRCAVRVDQRDVICSHDSVAYLLRHRETCARCVQGTIGEIREDAQRDFSIAQRLDTGRNGFAYRVDEVGTHCIAGIDDDVHGNERRSVWQGEQASLNVADAAATIDQPRMNAIGEFEQRVLRVLERHNGTVGVDRAHDVNLANQH